MTSIVGRRDTFGSGVIMFEAVLVSSEGENLTSTLINPSEVSVLDGSNVICTLASTNDMLEFQRRISVASLLSNSVNNKVYLTPLR